MFGRATIAGQGFQSGEINGRDSFSFPLPYAPFGYIKAITVGQRFPEPVTSMTVEIRTSSARFSGTNDDVYLRVGPGLRFNLDKRLYDDFERGDRDTYSVPIDTALLSGLSVGDIDRVQIEKSSDGVAGGWKLRGVKLVVERAGAVRARRHRALARGRQAGLAGAGLRAQGARRHGGADHAGPLGRGLVRLRRQRPGRHRVQRPPQAPVARVPAGHRRQQAGDRRQPPQRPARRRRPGVDHVRDPDADPDPRPGAGRGQAAAGEDRRAGRRRELRHRPADQPPRLRLRHDGRRPERSGDVARGRPGRRHRCAAAVDPDHRRRASTPSRSPPRTPAAWWAPPRSSSTSAPRRASRA